MFWRKNVAEKIVNRRKGAQNHTTSRYNSQNARVAHYFITCPVRYILAISHHAPNPTPFEPKKVTLNPDLGSIARASPGKFRAIATRLTGEEGFALWVASM